MRITGGHGYQKNLWTFLSNWLNFELFCSSIKKTMYMLLLGPQKQVCPLSKGKSVHKYSHEDKKWPYFYTMIFFTGLTGDQGVEKCCWPHLATFLLCPHQNALVFSKWDKSYYGLKKYLKTCCQMWPAAFFYFLITSQTHFQWKISLCKNMVIFFLHGNTFVLIFLWRVGRLVFEPKSNIYIIFLILEQKSSKFNQLEREVQRFFWYPCPPVILIF